MIEGTREIIKQRLGPAVTVGLKHHDFTTIRPAFFDGFQGGFNFSRMMTVIVHHCNCVHITFDFESALNPFKGFQGGLDGCKRHIQLDANGNAGGGIVDVVNTRQIQRYIAEFLAFFVNTEMAAPFFKCHIPDLEIGL